MATEHDEDRLAQLEARFNERLAQQQEQITRLEAALEVASTEPSTLARTGRTRHTITQRLKSSRRNLLKLGGAAAAAGVAAVALGTHQEAQAATGSALILGQFNDAGATTYLSPSTATSPSPVLHVGNAAVTSGWAVEGDGGTNGRGMYGLAYGDLGLDVIGFSDTGIGVYGNASSGTGVAGQSTSGLALAAFGSGRTYQQLQSQSGPPT